MRSGIIAAQESNGEGGKSKKLKTFRYSLFLYAHLTHLSSKY